MKYKKLHKIISRIYQNFGSWHIHLRPIEDESWDFNICKQRYETKVSYADKRTSGVRFTITPELKEDKVYIEMDQIVVMKSERRKGTGSYIVKLIFDAIGKKNISRVSVCDISEGFWEDMKKKHRTIKWEIS